MMIMLGWCPWKRIAVLWLECMHLSNGQNEIILFPTWVCQIVWGHVPDKTLGNVLNHISHSSRLVMSLSLESKAFEVMAPRPDSSWRRPIIPTLSQGWCNGAIVSCHVLTSDRRNITENWFYVLLDDDASSTSLILALALPDPLKAILLLQKYFQSCQVFEENRNS